MHGRGVGGVEAMGWGREEIIEGWESSDIAKAGRAQSAVGRKKEGAGPGKVRREGRRRRGGLVAWGVRGM